VVNLSKNNNFYERRRGKKSGGARVNRFSLKKRGIRREKDSESMVLKEEGGKAPSRAASRPASYLRDQGDNQKQAQKTGRKKN